MGRSVNHKSPQSTAVYREWAWRCANFHRPKAGDSKKRLCATASTLRGGLEKRELPDPRATVTAIPPVTHASAVAGPRESTFTLRTNASNRIENLYAFTLAALHHFETVIGAGKR